MDWIIACTIGGFICPVCCYLILRCGRNNNFKPQKPQSPQKQTKEKVMSNYEKTMDLKKEYEAKKAELEKVQKELMEIKQKAKTELEWILADDIETTEDK